MTQYSARGLVFILLVICCAVYIVTQNNSQFNRLVLRTENKAKTKRNSTWKSILLWNSAHRIETSSFGVGHEAFVTNNCSVSQCEIFIDRDSLPFEEYDAVVLHMHEIYVTNLPESSRRSQHQRYVFLTQESPQSMTINPLRYDRYFNWSMTYKLNSDVLLLYGRVTPKPSAPKNPEGIRELIRATHNWTKNYAANKTKLVAWMVSHCKTPGLRESYVKELSKYIDVDIYGECGSLNCPRNKTHWLSEPHCYDLLAGQYKFYLSFENSVCTDYATEKFFNILTKDLVPVVYGGADYGALAPAHSFVDAMRWTPRQLADHLRLLAANDTLYNEFFWWKDHYHVEAGVEQMARHGFCDLCKKLHEDSATKVYENIRMEWSRDSQCKQITGFKAK